MLNKGLEWFCRLIYKTIKVTELQFDFEISHFVYKENQLLEFVRSHINSCHSERSDHTVGNLFIFVGRDRLYKACILTFSLHFNHLKFKFSFFLLTYIYG